MPKSSTQSLSQAGEFYRRRDQWIDFVAERASLHPTARLVGIWLAKRINRKTGDTWHQVSTIALRLGVSPRTVIRAVAALEEAELLFVRRSGVRGKNQAVNRYELIFPWQ